MFADQLSWDEFGHSSVAEALTSEAQIRDRIAALDGHSRTLVTISTGAAHLAVGGDAGSKLIVYVTFDGELYHWVSADVENGDREVILVAGGQPGRYAARNLVTLDEALTAAKSFAEEGLLAVDLNWYEE